MAVLRITVIGGNLFDIAAQYLGDSTQAFRIAQANTIVDYFLPGNVPTSLIIPPVDPTITDGIPSQ